MKKKSFSIHKGNKSQEKNIKTIMELPTCCNSKSPSAGWWKMVVVRAWLSLMFLSRSTASNSSWLRQSTSGNRRLSIICKVNLIYVNLVESFKLIDCQHIGHWELLWHLIMNKLKKYWWNVFETMNKYQGKTRLITIIIIITNITQETSFWHWQHPTITNIQ